MTNRSFDQQIETYVARGFPAAAGLDEPGFRQRLEPLRRALDEAPVGDFSPVVVLKRDFATPAQLVEAIDRDDGKPDTVIDEAALANYGERGGIELPRGRRLRAGRLQQGVRVT